MLIPATRHWEVHIDTNNLVVILQLGVGVVAPFYHYLELLDILGKTSCTAHSQHTSRPTTSFWTAHCTRVVPRSAQPLFSVGSVHQLLLQVVGYNGSSLASLLRIYKVENSIKNREQLVLACPWLASPNSMVEP